MPMNNVFKASDHILDLSIYVKGYLRNFKRYTISKEFIQKRFDGDFVHLSLASNANNCWGVLRIDWNFKWNITCAERKQ